MTNTKEAVVNESQFKKDLFDSDKEIDNISAQIDECSEKLISSRVEFKLAVKEIKERQKKSEITQSDAVEQKNVLVKNYQETVKQLKADLNGLIDKNETQYARVVQLKNQPESATLKIQYKQEYVALKSEYKTALNEAKTANAANKEAQKQAIAEVKAKYKPQLLEKKEQIRTTTKAISKKLITILFLTVAPVVVLIMMLVNYLVFYPQTNIVDGKPTAYDFGKTENIIAVILAAILIISSIVFGYFFLKDANKRTVSERKKSFGKSIIIGFFTDFFDTIGVGSFAPTLVMMQAFGVSDNIKKVPGTLNVAHTIPVAIEAAVFIAAVNVEIITLVSLIICAVVGSYIGAALANKFNSLWIKLVMGIALFVTAIMMVLTHNDVQAFGTSAEGTNGLIGDGIPGWKLPVTMVIFVILGALMSLGVGLYAPAMATVVLMGMNADVAFPIMMGSCAFLMPVGSFKFIQDKNYYPKVSLGITIGGSVGVVTAFLVVFVGIQVGLGLSKKEFIDALLWLVIVVVFYASISMMYDFSKTTIKNKKQKLLIE